MEPFAAVYLGLALVGALMALAQRASPAGSLPPVFDRSRAIDWSWWLFSPIATGTLTRIFTLGTAFSLAWALGYGLDAGAMIWSARAHSPWHPWAHPLGLQLVEALVFADLVGYWSHRLRHTRWLWPFHAVHHSPERLDWLSPARMHPVDDLIDNVTVGLSTLALFNDRVFAMLGPLLLTHTIFTHAAVTWSLGPFKYLLVSPTAHRWHHAADGAREGRNFAGMFSLFDVIFGTFHQPEAILPTRFGAPDQRVPGDLLGQLAHPFRALFAMLNSRAS